eukprot:2978808-Prymnesium_polylepis.1
MKRTAAAGRRPWSGWARRVSSEPRRHSKPKLPWSALSGGERRQAKLWLRGGTASRGGDPGCVGLGSR